MRRVSLALLFCACATAAQAQMVTVQTAATANTLVAKSTGGGNLVSAYATGPAAQTGFLMIFPATTAPVDGTVAPQDCVPMANGLASINYGISGPPAPYNGGIVIVLSSGANCFTKTTGTITAFIHAVVQ